jgi:hypothetical protein
LNVYEDDLNSSEWLWMKKHDCVYDQWRA